jgi:crotonobetaine/carnitine-CoA ligase
MPARPGGKTLDFEWSEAQKAFQASVRRLPEFMIPRYLEFVSALPKTASEKNQKLSLKSRGIKSAWDRLGQ